ncbi:PREDICTED: odorant receptor 85b-like [Dufourea novaeangliae]|nr:PREDICTED: odorant receptor 85b-like [Dufourea novaeangliae]
MLPTTSEKIRTPGIMKFYVLFVWTIVLACLSATLYGMVHVPNDKMLKDSTVYTMVSFESILLVVYLHNQKKSLRRLIETLNCLFDIDDKTIRIATTRLVTPFEKPMKIYVIASVGAVIVWTFLPLMEIFHRNQFYYEDYQIPMGVSREPFSTGIFIGGIAFQIVGCMYTTVRKASVDIYTMHIILLMTAQYKYLNMKFTSALARYPVPGDEDIIRQELGGLVQHHKIVLRISNILKNVFTPNVALLYINNVFRFCFLTLMLVMNNEGPYVTMCVVSYTIGALIQLYMFCFCIQQLLESSTTMMDDVFHGKWYLRDVSLQRTIMMMTMTDKLGCKLSRIRNINLTLPSFMSILNQAYSVCLLFLKSRQS